MSIEEYREMTTPCLIMEQVDAINKKDQRKLNLVAQVLAERFCSKYDNLSFDIILRELGYVELEKSMLLERILKDK